NLEFINPVRIVDTRPSDAGAGIVHLGYDEAGNSIPATPLAAGSIRRFSVCNANKNLTFPQGTGGGTFSFPRNITGVLVNVTIIGPGPSGGFVTVFPGGIPDAQRPNASTLNPATALAFNFWETQVFACAGGTVPVPTGGTSGTIAVFSTNQLDLAMDVV